MISNMSPQKQNDPKFSAQPDAAFKTDIVDNIPLHQATTSEPVSEAENIDGIMKDVSKEVKKVDEAPPKHHLFGHKEKPKPAGHHSAPVAPAPAPPAPAASGPMPRQPAPPAPKPKAKSPKPVMVIIFTVIITAFLIIAAISAYKK
jgi:hypothetical protein